MASKNQNAEHLLEFLFRWRWGIVLFSAIGIILFEFLEHQPFQRSWDSALILETILYGVAFPVLLGVLLSLFYTRFQLNRVKSRGDFQDNSQTKLTNVRDWQDLITTLLHMPRTLFDLQGDALFLVNKEKGKYTLVDQWCVPGFLPPREDIHAERGACSLAAENGRANSISSSACLCAYGGASTSFKTMCFPLRASGEEIGLIQLYFNPKEMPGPDKIDLFNKLLPLMALSIEIQQGRSQSQAQVSAAEAERRRIARYLHNSLLPNLAYLRLQLDRFSQDYNYENNPALYRELGRVIEIANESYENTRQVLVELREEDTIILREALRDVIRVVERRSGLSVEFQQQGNDAPLLPNQARMVLLVIREALRNIENHAHASQICLRLNWLPDTLSIEVEDNGLGFHPASIRNRKGHYGLQMISEVAEELRGGLEIDSQPGSGTQVRFWFPRPKDIRSA